MTQYTTPDVIPVPESGDEIAPLEEWLEDQAVAVQAALLRPGTFNTAGQRDAALPSPSPGMTVWRNDVSRREMYLPGGIVAGSTAGWYPIDGLVPTYAVATPRDTFPAQTGIGTTSTTLKLPTAPSRNSGDFGLDPTVGNISILQAGLYSIGAGVRASANAQLAINVNGTTVAATKLTDIFTNVTIPAIYLFKGDVVAFALQAISGTVNVVASQRYHALRYLGPA